MARLSNPPERDSEGNHPALAYGRASIARGIIRDCLRAGLSQKALAQRAGLRPETLCRIESGLVTPTVASIDKIDRALKRALEKTRTRDRKSGVKKTRDA